MKKDIRKVESAIVVALFLISGLLIALPAVTAVGVSAYSASPAAITGATATIDYPIIAGVATSAVAGSRVISVTNPAGNPGITTITISVPAAAVSASPTGSIPSYGGVPDCSAGCNAQTFGSGPYAVQYTDTSSAGAVILPGGATISILLTITPETAVTSTTGTDTFSLSTTVTETGGSSTVLSSIAIYEVAATTTLTVTGSAITTQQTAGVPFSVSASSSASGLPLYVSAIGRSSGTPHPTLTISPASFTSGSSSTSLSVNDTAAENLQLTVGGPAATHATGALLTNATTSVINVAAGPLSQITVAISQGLNSYNPSNANQVNVTSMGQGIILGSAITVTTTDRFNNLVTTGTTTVTLTAITASGQTAVFTSDSVYNTANAYPYTPTSSTLTAPVTLTGGTGNPTTNFYVGPNYGSRSYISASASNGLTGVSLNIATYAFSTAAPTMAASSSLVSAGKSSNITANLPVVQAGVPMYFQVDNSSAYSGTFTGGQTYVTATSVATGPASAAASLVVDTKSGASTNVLGGYFATPTTTSTNATLASPVVTQAGAAASLVIKSYFDTTYLSTSASTSIVAKGTLYLNVGAADAYGNTVTATSSNTVQVTLSVANGALSTSIAFINPTFSDTVGSGYTIQYVAPSTTGSSVISATAVYNGVSVSGTTTVSIVSATPTITLTSSPTSITTGVPQSVKGYVNASAGIQNNVISTLEYSLNGAANQTLPAGIANPTFTITATFGASNIVTIYAKDSASTPNWATMTINVPPLTPATTFTNSSSVNKITFTNGPQAINATFTNNSPNTYTVIVVGQVYQNQSGTFVPLSPPITSTLTNVATTSSASAYLLLQGYAPGTYQVKITVYSLEYITYSTPITLTVTVS